MNPDSPQKPHPSPPVNSAMPLDAILRRASASMVPLAIRAVRNQIALSTLFPVQSSGPGLDLGLGLSLGQKLTRPSFVPIAKFSTDADENPLRVLETEIDCADDPKGEPITDRIPFEIHDNPGDLTRKYGDGVIEAVVSKVTDEDDDDGDDYDVPTVEGDGDGDCYLVPASWLVVDENKQKVLQKYLEDRGFEDISSLIDYMEEKGYSLWPNNLKKFDEK